MTDPKKRPGAISAIDALAELQKDEDYQRGKEAFDAELRERAQVLRSAEQPIVDALHNAEVRVDSVWDLINTADPYPDALPILIEQLERGNYPDRVMESLGRALAVKPAVAYWDRLKKLYLAPRNLGEQEGVAVALAGCATKAELDDLIRFLSLEERGQTRIYFLRPIKRYGGDRGREVLESLREDPTLGREARALLKS